MKRHVAQGDGLSLDGLSFRLNFPEELVQRVQVPNILRTLVPKTIPLMVLGPESLKHWVLGPSG